MARNWTTEESAALYNLKGWGLKYFAINEEGHVTVCPRRDPARGMDLKRIVDDAVGRGIKLPILLRFQDILRHRVVQLNEAFKRAIEEYKYKGRYLGVYPIKVNQLREVVEEILDAGEPYQYGLEAGSKSELMAVLALTSPQSLAVVNGYKDEGMMRLAGLGAKMGKKVVVVIEKLGELKLLMDVSRSMGVTPTLGLRAKLSAQGTGKWRSSSGDQAKFGLSTPELLGAAETLRAAGLTDGLKLLHFHVGSQITDIQALKDAVKEAARVYAKLRKMGFSGLELLDCGGGLGVDYDGTHTVSDSSMNYNLREYVSTLVYTVQEVCRQEKVPEPDIVTESGRALVAHHSILALNVFGSIEAGSAPVQLTEEGTEPDVVKELRDILKGLNPKDLAEAYHDAQSTRDEAFSLFKLGYLGLEDKAKAENLYSRICREIASMLPGAKYRDEELEQLALSLNDQYLCNFSLFQSLPDSWALGQLFPIVPLSRLDEEPTRRAALADITCDSDGRIGTFVCRRKAQNALPLHSLNGEPYYLGIFLMGAYQASMGDIHNLFGRLNEVHVFEDDSEPGGYYLEEVIRGQTIREVLADVQYSEFELVKMVKSALDVQVKAGALKPREGAELLDRYEAFMEDYTYIDMNGRPAPGPAGPPESSEAVAQEA